MTDAPERVWVSGTESRERWWHSDDYEPATEYVHVDIYEAQAAEIERLRGLLRAIIEADERGQGQPFAEAMQKARAALGEDG